MSTVSAIATIDLRFFRIHSEGLFVEMRRFEADGSEERGGATLGKERAPIIANLELERSGLGSLYRDPILYGKNLTHQLFASEELRQAFSEMMAVAQNQHQGVRLRLLFDASAEDLKGLRWELLQDPIHGDLLSTSEWIYFCRFLYSSSWRPIRLRRRTEMRALAAIASPANSPEHGLEEIQKDQELAWVPRVFTDVRAHLVGLEEPCTQEALFDVLRQGIDVLYLMCHGELGSDGVPYLMLEDDYGGLCRVRGDALAGELGRLEDAPRLVVLASCESAGRDDGYAVGSMARQLIEAGIPAVVAMQGRLSHRTAARLLPALFDELMRDGRIDRALAVARGQVRDRPDAWLPVLYLRLAGGRIWYEPGFGDQGEDEVRWKALSTSIHNGEFTPIVGWGFAEGIYGSPHDLARRLAGDHLPEVLDPRSDLPQVLQYLQTDQDSHFALEKAIQLMRKEILFRRPELEEVAQASFQGLLSEAGRLHRSRADDPYRILANLPARVYINASLDNLLVDALRDAGREPEIRCPVWRADQRQVKYKADPTVERPLVYQMFGSLDDENSMVLTEDDYFEFLIGFSENRDLVPPVVRNALSGGSLLFLGFQLTDWSFRVLFRLVLHQGGGRRREKYTHAAVQVDPGAEQASDVQQVRRYLETYFGVENIRLFWGRSEDFLVELEQQLRSMPQGREQGEF